ncbi:MAG: hypothetical protein R3D71_02030 [Rickettsiales bacterium]
MNRENNQSYYHQLGNFLGNELSGKLWQFARGSIQLSSAATFGVVGTAVATIVFSALTIFRHNRIEKKWKESLLELYADKISNITGKPKTQLTVNDLENVADTKILGEKNPISLELKAIQKNSNIGRNTSLASILIVAALATVTAGLISPTLLTGAGFIMANTVFGIVTNAVFMSVDHAMSKSMGGKDKYAFNNQLKELINYNRSNKLEPEQTFGILLETHSDINNEINRKYDKPYSNLPMAIKSNVVDHYEHKLHTKALTKMINNNEIDIPELGLIAYKQTPYQIDDTHKDNSDSTPYAVSYNNASYRSDHVDRLSEQRLSAQESRTIH